MFGQRSALARGSDGTGDRRHDGRRPLSRRGIATQIDVRRSPCGYGTKRAIRVAQWRRSILRRVRSRSPTTSPA